MIKLVALDLDGTIVNEHLKISSRVLSTLKHLITQTDVRVVIATGRMFPSALPFAREIGIREPIITYQGAMIRDLGDGHALRFHSPIQLGLAREIMQSLVAENYHVNLYMHDRIWTRPNSRYTDFYTKTSGVEPIFHDDLLDCLTTDPTKIMVIDDDRVDLLLQDLSRNYTGKLTFCRSRSNFCEIIDVAASKWNALKALADEWGIRPEEIMAIGDQGNDLSMITQAGVGVAMGNAPDDVKCCADYVAPPIDQDGAAEAIERFVLDGKALTLN
ncbi:MAG TPA: Cof-type HAD-IIB family hydrolase [Oculatellaceae cyanobacterium]|jgi:Cof subfamily protein (haloacid dehalogenase superfamily)